MKDNTIRELIKKAVEEAAERHGFEIEQVVLFGSRSRKDHRAESDWDILVVIKPNKDMDRKDLWFKIYKALHAKFNFSFDIIVKFSDDFEREKDIVNTISNEAKREGIIL